MTVLHLERHLVDGSRRRAYEESVARLLAAMRLAPGFLWADAAGSLADPEVVTVCSEWRTEADLEAFLAGGAYAAFREASDGQPRAGPGRRRYTGG